MDHCGTPVGPKVTWPAAQKYAPESTTSHLSLEIVIRLRGGRVLGVGGPQQISECESSSCMFHTSITQLTQSSFSI
jgi:hypothetical protein